MKRVPHVLAFAVVLLLLIGCRSEQQVVEEYLETAAPLLSEWVDGHLQATMTSRSALAPIIDNLRLIRSRYDALGVPKPCEQLHRNVLDSMDYSIDGFLAKLAGELDELALTTFALEDQKMVSTLEELAELREEYGD